MGGFICTKKRFYFKELMALVCYRQENKAVRINTGLFKVCCWAFLTKQVDNLLCAKIGACKSISCYSKIETFLL